MSKKNPQSSRQGYHHGNLREALVNAALELVESGQEWSLRTAAARAGVSTAAPYRHFEDREALLAAVSAIGFDRLLDVLAKARPNAKERSKVAAMSRAYLGFAAQHRGLYLLMFTGNHLAVRFDPALAKSSADAFAELEGAVAAELKTPDPSQIKLVSTALWATMHGVAMLSFDRLIPAGGPPDEAAAREVSLAVAKLTADALLGP